MTEKCETHGKPVVSATCGTPRCRECHAEVEAFLDTLPKMDRGHLELGLDDHGKVSSRVARRRHHEGPCETGWTRA